MPASSPAKTAFLPSPNSARCHAFRTHVTLQKDFEQLTVAPSNAPSHGPHTVCPDCDALEGCMCCVRNCASDDSITMLMGSRTGSAANSAASSFKSSLDLPRRLSDVASATLPSFDASASESGDSDAGRQMQALDATDMMVQHQVRSSHDAWQAIRYVRRSVGDQVQQQQQQPPLATQQQPVPAYHARNHAKQYKNNKPHQPSQYAAPQQPQRSRTSHQPYAPAQPVACPAPALKPMEAPPLPSFMQPRAQLPPVAVTAVVASPLVAWASHRK